MTSEPGRLFVTHRPSSTANQDETKHDLLPISAERCSLWCGSEMILRINSETTLVASPPLFASSDDRHSYAVVTTEGRKGDDRLVSVHDLPLVQQWKLPETR